MNIFKRSGVRDENQEGGEHHEHMDMSAGSPGTGSVARDSKAFDAYSFWILLGMLFLLPIIFVPNISVPFQFTKTLLVFAGVLIAFLITVVSRLREGRLTLTWHYILYGVWALPVAYFVASVFSNNPRLSFLGQSLESDTFAFITLMAVFVTLIVMLIRSKEQVLTSYLVLFVSFVVLWVFQGLRLIFGPGFLSFKTLTLSTSNVLGKWNDLSIFFGLATVMLLVTLASLKLSSAYKKVFYVMLLISLFFLAIVNFMLTWVIVGVFALGFLVHSLSIGRFRWSKAVPVEVPMHEGGEGEQQPVSEKKSLGESLGGISIAPLVVFIVSLAFVLSGTTGLGNYIANTFHISQIEARPSWQTTVSIAKHTYQHNAIFGSGPNTFAEEWAAARPVELNTSIFWNADFISGIGSIPTAFVTTGIVGGIVWLLLILLYIWSGLRSLIAGPSENRYAYFVSLSSFLAGLYLWIFMIFYTPNVVLITLAFFFTGIYIASLRHSAGGDLKERTFIFAGNPKTGFVSVFGLTFLLIVILVSMYTVLNIYRSAILFQDGVITLNVNGDVDKAQDLIAHSAALYETDRQYRILANISVARIARLQTQTDLSPDDLRNEFQLRLAQGVEAGQRATEIDPNNYQNWIARGQVYQSVTPLGIQGAYENALSSYQQALTLNPNGPGVYLALARLEVAHKDNLKARDYITEALKLKSNYTEAVFLLSQLEINDGNVDKAIKSVEAATILAPTNPVLFFQLGLLKYHENDNDGAIAAFEHAVALSKDYANARYFLGLTYDRVGRRNDAITQFEKVQALNPDNKDVSTIISNLKANRKPFANLTQPTTDIPSTPPVTEPPQGEEADASVLDVGTPNATGTAPSEPAGDTQQ